MQIYLAVGRRSKPLSDNYMSQGDPVYFRPLPLIMSMLSFDSPPSCLYSQSPYNPIDLYKSSLSSNSHIAFTNFPWFPFRGQSNSVLHKIARSLSSSSLSYNDNDDDNDDHDDDGNNELYRILIFHSLEIIQRLERCRKIRCVIGADAKVTSKH